MAVRGDQGLHRVRVEPEVLVVLRHDIRGGQRQEMKEALLVDLGVQRQAPVGLAVAVPVPTREEVGDVVHLLHRLGRCRQVVAVLRLELLLIAGIGQNVPAVVEALRVGVEQHAVPLAFPGVEALDRRKDLAGLPVGEFLVLQHLVDRDDVRRLGDEVVAVEPGARLVDVVPVEPGREIGEDLLVQRLDRHGRDVDGGTGLLLPVLGMRLDRVADGGLDHHHVEGDALIGLLLQELDALGRDRRLVGRHGRAVEQRAVRRERALHPRERQRGSEPHCPCGRKRLPAGQPRRPRCAAPGAWESGIVVVLAHVRASSSDHARRIACGGVGAARISVCRWASL